MLQFIAVILILAALLLTIPVKLVFALKKDDTWRGRIVVIWLFGLTRAHIRPGRRQRDKRLKRRWSLLRSGRAAGKKLFRRRRMLLLILRSEGFMRQAITLFRDLLRSLRPRRFRLRCVMGFKDPADTGRLMGLLAPLRVFARSLRVGRDSSVAIQVTPDFSGPRFQGYCSASVQFVPLKLFGIFLGFLFSPPVFRAAKALVQRPKA